MDEIDWKEFARVFDTFSNEQYAAIMHRFYLWIVETLDEGERDPGDFADLGCGTGLLVEKMVEWYPDARFELVDSNEHMLEVARERFAGSSGVRLHRADAGSYLEQCPAESIDVAVFCRSWYAVEEPQATAQAVLTALRPGGRVFLFDFTRPIDVDALDAFYREREPDRWPACRAAYDDFNQGVASGRYKLYSRAELEGQWASAGGQVTAYESYEPVKPSHQICVTRP